jgi:polyhydroxybutyrate depolymerase
MAKSAPVLEAMSTPLPQRFAHVALIFLLSLFLLDCRARSRGLGHPELLQHGTFAFQGRERSYAYVTPPHAGSSVPLVMALHGRFGTGEGQEQLGPTAELARAEGFFLLLPDGVDMSWNDARHVGPAAEQQVDDVAFLVALLENFAAQHPVDLKRVYLMGMSNGGMMAHTVACAHGERFAAFGSVTANLPAALDGHCVPSRPISVALVLGTKDPLVPYLGGEVLGSRGKVLSADASLRHWARLNGCEGEAAVLELADKAPDDGTHTRVFSYGKCREGSEVVLYSVEGGGHTWPGGWQYLGEEAIGKSSRDFSASEELWRFFRRHKR